LSSTRPLAGHIALLCQSAAVMRSVIDWATSRDIGFSHVISVGMRWDVDFGDLIGLPAAGQHTTRAILMYMENTRNRRKFVSAARAAARSSR
jgi:acetyltransferase